jgi:hypothetical protein
MHYGGQGMADWISNHREESGAAIDGIGVINGWLGLGCGNGSGTTPRRDGPLLPRMQTV